MKKLTKEKKSENYHMALGKWMAIYAHIKNDGNMRSCCERLVRFYEPKKNQKP